MAATTKEKTRKGAVSSNDTALENIIESAIEKISGTKENDLCKYLPAGTDGYIHHFTMRKMKTEAPTELLNMIKEFIINVDKPSKVSPKRRAPRGSRKRLNELNLSKKDFDRLLSIAQSTGDRDLISKLMPKKTLKTLKRELIASIRKEEANHDLWNYYVEASTGQSTATNTSNISGTHPFLSENDMSKLFTK